MRNVLKRIFEFLSFFLCDILFLGYRRFCIQQWLTVNLIQTLTSEDKDWNQKH